MEVAEYAQAFVVPLLKMLLAIYEGPEPFNAALVDALEAHQRYYTTGTRNNDPRGFVALGPLALCSWADDCMIPVTVESGYIPKWLVEGAFERE